MNKIIDYPQFKQVHVFMNDCHNPQDVDAIACNKNNLSKSNGLVHSNISTTESL